MAGSVEPIEVVVSGHLCLDMIPEMDHVPREALSQPGYLAEVGRLALSTGGAVSNTGLALQRLGIGVRLMACVGDDFVGGAILDFINRRDSSLTQYITVKDGQPSSYTIILSPAKVDRIFLHSPSTNTTFGIEDLNFTVIRKARIFHLGYPPVLPRLILDDGAELARVYQEAKGAGVVTSLDMCLPDPDGFGGSVDWRKILQATLPYVDIFVPSIEEILFMLRRADYDAWQGGHILSHITADYLDALGAELLDMGAVIAGFKLGEMGFYLRTAPRGAFESLHPLPIDPDEWASRRVWSPAFDVDGAGTTGAGDSAYAGLLGALLRGMSPVEAARWACAVGACNVEAADATSGVLSWAETQARLEAGWPQHTVKLPGYVGD
jgi:sugar/nucleoside kinase (ribokinase family)